MNPDDPIFRAWFDATQCWLAGAGLPPIKPPAAERKNLYVRAPCDALVKPADLEAHKETCEACLGGWSMFDRAESEERYLDDPKHGQAKDLNAKR